MDSKICIICDAIVTTESRKLPTLCERHNDAKYRNAIDKVKQEHNRALKRGMSPDLTVPQWVSACEHFNWSCVYCGRQRNERIGIDHWKPLSRGGNTTAINCVPSCPNCNIMKGAATGQEFLELLIEVFESPVAYSKLIEVINFQLDLRDLLNPRDTSSGTYQSKLD